MRAGAAFPHPSLTRLPPSLLLGTLLGHRLSLFSYLLGSLFRIGNNSSRFLLSPFLGYLLEFGY